MRLPCDIVFYHSDSGQTKITCETGTLQPNVKVEVTETHTKQQSLSQDGTLQNVYIYKIDAFLETVDALGTHRTPVDSLEKPLTITLPTEHLGTTGICYVGIKYPDSNEWEYRGFSEGGVVARSTRLSMYSTNKLEKEYICIPYKMGIQIALFLYNPIKAPETETSNIVCVNSITATSTAKVMTKKNVYKSNLDVVLDIEGENLGNLMADDVSVKVTYRSKSENPAKIKINGQEVKNQQRKPDDAVKGEGIYAYSFTGLRKNLLSLLTMV